MVSGCSGRLDADPRRRPPYEVLGAFARDYHEFVEPIFDPDCCCWTPGNSVPSSNHPRRDRIRPPVAIAPLPETRQLHHGAAPHHPGTARLVRGTVFWAGIDWKKLDRSQGGWGSPIDEMHWQMGYGTYDQAAGRVQPWVSDFIARKIRTDGFSTFRRGGTGGAPTPSVDAAAVLAKAAGIPPIAKATEILPEVAAGLRGKSVHVGAAHRYVARPGWPRVGQL